MYIRQLPSDVKL